MTFYQRSITTMGLSRIVSEKMAISVENRTFSYTMNLISGVGTGGSGGSMNRGPRAPGPPSSGATENFLGKTLRKIIKIVAIRGRILRLKCTKFDFGWGLAADPAGGELTSLPRPPSWIWGPLRGRGGAELGNRRGRGGRGKWRGGKASASKLLLNQGPSEPCYATEFDTPAWSWVPVL